jgi:GT2 family glycosyltransferase
MFIDSDINFDAEDIFRLMAWNSDPKKGIVAGIPVARKKGKVYISTLDTDEQENILMNYMGLVKAKRVATAFMMIRREVFEKLRDTHPEWVYHDEKKVGDEVIAFFDFALKDGQYIGEDFLFCDRARELGYEVWIDPTIKLGHMGMEEFAGAFGEDYLYPLMKSIESKKDAA